MDDLRDQCYAFTRYEMEVVENFFRAIREWSDKESLRLAAIGESLAEMEDLSPSEQFQAVQEYSDDQEFTIRTKRLMYASLSISISSTIEKVIEAICKWTPLNVVPSSKSAKAASQEDKRRAIEKRFDFHFRGLNGSNAANRIRILSNCFKHNRGRVLAMHESLLGFPSERSIPYESEDWQELLSHTTEYLRSLCDNLAGHAASGREVFDDYIGIVDVPIDECDDSETGD